MTHGVSTPLRVLVVAAGEPWPLQHGGHLRLYNFLRHLAGVAHVTLAIPGPSRHAAELPAGVQTVSMADTPRAMPDVARPPLAIRMARRHFGCEAGALTWLMQHANSANFDVVLLYGASVGHYIDALDIPAVWDVVDDPLLYLLRDAQWQPATSWPRMLCRAGLYAIVQRHVAQRCAALLLTSPVDASCARRYVGDARVVSLTNGVDFDYFRRARYRPDPGTIAFVGGLCFPPNVEAATRFARRIWPHIRAGSPVRRFLLVGGNPEPAVRDLARLHGVELYADVPDVRPYLDQASVIVVPTRLGGGVKNKVLEACAAGRPVVASAQALAGLTALPGADALCATNDASWVRQVTRLLENPEQAACIADAGHRWVRRAHDWSTIAGELHELLASAATRRAPTASHLSAVAARRHHRVAALVRPETPVAPEETPELAQPTDEPAAELLGAGRD